MRGRAEYETVSRRRSIQCMVAACAAGLVPAAGQAESKRRRAVAVAVEIRKRRVTAVRNKTIRVTEGDDVRIDWTSDEAVDLHLHGYDIEAGAAPGRPASMAFRAHTAGRFPVTAHNFGHRTLLYLEVYPR